MSDEESEDREEPFSDHMVLISLAGARASFANVASCAPKSCKSPISLTTVVAIDAEIIGAKSSDDEEISIEEMVHSYKVMYEKLVDALNENKVLHKQISLLCSEENEFVKQNNMLHDKLYKQGESLNELKQIKKNIHMMNFGTMTLKTDIGDGKKN